MLSRLPAGSSPDRREAAVLLLCRSGAELTGPSNAVVAGVLGEADEALDAAPEVALEVPVEEVLAEDVLDPSAPFNVETICELTRVIADWLAMLARPVDSFCSAEVMTEVSPELALSCELQLCCWLYQFTSC
jgi:hypothetical protein